MQAHRNFFPRWHGNSRAVPNSVNWIGGQDVVGTENETYDPVVNYTSKQKHHSPCKFSKLQSKQTIVRGCDGAVYPKQKLNAALRSA